LSFYINADLRLEDGVTRQSAPKILKLLGTGANEAFDVSLSSFCTAGQLRCVVVNPQIMNHYEPPKDAGYLSQVRVGDGKGETAQESEFEFKMGTTGNIEQSARCKALFDDVCMAPPWELCSSSGGVEICSSTAP